MEKGNKLEKKIIVETLLQTDKNSLNQPIVYPNTANAEITVEKITFAPGAVTDWHKHSIPLISYIIKGTLTVETEDRQIREFTENTSFIASNEVYHKGANLGQSEAVVIAVYLGEKGQKLEVSKNN